MTGIERECVVSATKLIELYEIELLQKELADIVDEYAVCAACLEEFDAICRDQDRNLNRSELTEYTHLLCRKTALTAVISKKLRDKRGSKDEH